MSLESVNRKAGVFNRIALIPLAVLVGAAITAKPVEQVSGAGVTGTTDKNQAPRSAPALDPCRDELLGEIVVVNGVRRLTIVARPGENPNDPYGILQRRREECRRSLPNSRP